MKKAKKLLKTTWKCTVKKYKKLKNLLMTSESKIHNMLTNSKTRYIFLKYQNKAILEEAQDKEQFQVERSNYDLFGKSIFK